MRYIATLFGLLAIVLICLANPLKVPSPSNSNAEELLAVDSQTAHENQSEKKTRQVFYSPYYRYGGYGGYAGYGGYYGGYGGYGLYGYRGYPYYGYGYYPYKYVVYG